MTLAKGRVKFRLIHLWIHSPWVDSLFILGPPLFSVFLVLFLNQQLELPHSIGPFAWLTLIVGVDVAHVYASLFRTYWDSSLQARALLWTVPLVCWGTGAVLYAMGSNYFWMALTYLAVFHFVRQQYGFAMIYSRQETGVPLFFKRIDRLTIYAATVYPLLFWHTHLPRQFNWFVDGDFIRVDSPAASALAGWAYVFLILTYLLKEILMIIRFNTFNLPRNLVIGGTAFSWYIGIVRLNNDFAFTVTNVVSHGIPYLALVWIYGRNNPQANSARIFAQSFFRLRMVPIFLGLLFSLAYLEEGFWDGFIWRDHPTLFPAFRSLPIIRNQALLTLLVPLLALPQSTHYIFDAFLWRFRGKNNSWKKILLNSKEVSP